MSERVGDIEVKATLEDSDLIAGLKRAELAVERTAEKIRGERAEAHIGADISELKRKAAEARAEIAKLNALRASPNIDKDQKRALQEQVSLRRQEVAEVQKQLAAAKSRLDTERAGNKEAQRGLKLKESAVRLEEAGEKASIKRAKAQQRADRDAVLGIAQQRAEVAKLERDYARMSDKVERATKKRKRAGFGETLVKAQIEERDAIAQFELLKAKLKVLGRVPPVGIKVDTDFSHLSGFRKVMAIIRRDVTDTSSKILSKIANISDLTLRLGPFTGSLKQFALALSVLGPTITDLLGSASALIGVMGAGIAGAAAVGAGGLVGFLTAFGGLKLSIKTAAADFKIAQQATAAYTKAVDKYGKSSKQAKQAQQQMNSVLAHVSPLAKEAALGAQEFQTGWDKSTKSTQRSLGSITKGFFSALNTIRPMWAHSTNELAKILDTNLKGGFKFLKSPEFKQAFQDITSDFNKSIPSLLHGLGSLGRAFLNFAQEGSKFLPDLTAGIDHFASSVLKFTQKDDFGATVKRWVNYAEDLVHFFGAATRVMVHFFGLGSSAGDKMVKDMTGALNRWDKFLQSGPGQEKFKKFFSDAVAGTQTLFKALAPLIQLFAVWSAALAPAVRVITQISAAITKVVNGLGHLVGLNNPIAAVGATLGAAFAIGKIGAFVAMLARAVTLMRELGAAGSIKALATGGLGGKASKAALAGEVATDAALVAGSRGRVAKDVAKSGILARVASGGFSLLRGAVTSAAGAYTIIGGAAAFAAFKILSSKNETQKAKDEYNKAKSGATDAAAAFRAMANSSLGVAQSQASATISLKSAKAALAATKKGTIENRDAMLQYRSALINQKKATEDWHKVQTDEHKTAEKQFEDAQRAKRSFDEASASIRKRTEAALKQETNDRRRADLQRTLDTLNKNAAVTDARVEAAHNRVAATTANLARQYRGLTPLVGRAEQALGKLARAGGPKLSNAIALKFPSAADVGRVASSAGKTIKSGVSPKITLKIVADAKNANDAVKTLQAVRLTPKKLQILASDASARSKVRQLVAMGIPPKIAKLLVHDAATGKIKQVDNYKLHPKSVSVDAKVAAALAGVRAVASALATLHDRTLNVTTHFGTSGAIPSAVAVHRSGNAAGGRPGIFDGSGASQPNQRQIDRAFVTAEMAGARRTRGGKYNQPSLLVGEENRSEFVISTNPKYRNRNLGFLAQAAQKLGAGVISAAGGFGGRQIAKAKAKAKGTKSLDPAGSIQGSGFFPSSGSTTKGYGRSSVFKPTRKKGGKVKSRRGWATYIEDLKTQQGYWEREVSIRESQVKEPGDMIVRDPTNDKVVKDPVTGEETKTEAFKVNPDIESLYKPALNKVMEAMQTLMGIIAELVRAIPEAVQANRAERTQRKGSMDHLTELIHGERRAMNNIDPKSKNAKERKAKLQKEIDKHKDQRDHEKEIYTQLREDEKTLIGDQTEAGFAYREAQIAFSDIKNEYDTASPNAQQALTDQQAQDAASGVGGAGGGGAAGGALSTAQQASIVLSAAQDTLRQFGSNFSNTYGGVVPQFAMTPRSAGAPGSGGGFYTASSGYSSGAAAAGAVGSSGSYRTAPAPTTSAASGGDRMAPAGDTKNIEIVNNYAAPPPDPHSWSKGMAFEVGAAL